MSGNVKTQVGKIIGKTLNSYYPRVKSTIDDLKFKQEYQDRIIDCMVGEVDDNYITTPETDNPIVKLEHSKEGLVKVPTVKGKTILVDAEGNETDTPAEGCRLLSVGEQEDNKLIILSKNKNIFNKANIIYNSYFSGGGGVGNTIDLVKSNRHCCVLIKVQPNTEYVFSSTNLLCYLREMQTEKIESGCIYSYSSITGFITKPQTNYLAINIRLEDENAIITSSDVDNSNIMIRKSKTTSEYVEPKSHKTEILLDEPLRSLPNGVYDEIVGNKIIRRVGKVVLDGSESWIFNTSFDKVFDDVYVFHNQHSLLENKPIISNSFLVDNDNTNCERIRGNDIYIFVYISKEKVSDNPYDFKQWLSKNPITILYELEEPIIEELPNGITLQGFDDTTMYIENSITPTVSYGYNALIPYKQELLNQKEEVDINTSDIENNIIPYLMDMEFNLIMMGDEE